MKSSVVMLGALCFLTGCASTVGTFFNRPVVEDRIGEKLSTVSLSADRRTIIVPHGGRGSAIFCAEPPPDTATSLKTDFNTALKYKGNEATVADKFETAITVLSARNAPLDAFRTSVFTICQFYLISAINEQNLIDLFKMSLETYERTQNAMPPIAKTAAKEESAPEAKSGVANAASKAP